MGRHALGLAEIERGGIIDSVPETVILEMQRRRFELRDELHEARDREVEQEKVLEGFASTRRWREQYLVEVCLFLDCYGDSDEVPHLASTGEPDLKAPYEITFITPNEVA